MSTVETNPGPMPSREPFGYAFAGVTFELARGRLLVDGNDSAAGPLILKLLAVLCRSPGLLVSRQQLFDAIWPRQTVSDEALTKLIARLRETLGPYGRSLVTLRGRGVRLDAEVTVLQAPAADVQTPTSAAVSALADEAANESAALRPAEFSVTTATPARRTIAVVTALLLLLAALVWAALRPLPAPNTSVDADAIVLSGFAITEADLETAKPATRDMLRQAGAAIDNGEVERAMTLFQVAHDADLSSPVPGALLAYTRSRKRFALDPKLQQEVAARLGEASTPYVRLLVRLSADSFARIDQGAPTLAAMVAMRPTAWRFQLQLAHLSLSLRHETAALTALRAIPADASPAYLIVTALSDRASLGDAAAVVEALEQGALGSASPEYRALVLGRLAWTGARPGAAIAKLDEAAMLATRTNNSWIEINARLYAALFAFHGGQPDAEVRLEQTASLIRRTTTLETHLGEIDALLAQLLLERGDATAAADLLRSVAGRYASEQHHAQFEVFNARLGLLLPAGSFLAEARRETLRQQGHLAAVYLADAWVAHVRGDDPESRRQLDQAKSAGVHDSYLREDAAALAAALDGSTAQCRPDPPYPNLLRFSTCRLPAARE